MLPSLEFRENLLNEITAAISEGSEKIAFWGLNPDGLSVLSMINKSGLITFISVLIDSNSRMQGRAFFGFEVQPPERLLELNFDTLVITSDQNKEHILEEFARLNNVTPRVIFSGNANYEFNDPIYQEILKSCPVKSKAGGY